MVFRLAIFWGRSFLGGTNFRWSAEHFHNLLFFDQECTNDTFTYALMAQDTTVCTGNGLLTLWNACTFAGTCWPDALKLLFALTAFCDVPTFLNVLVDQTATRCTNTKIKWKDRKRIKYQIHVAEKTNRNRVILEMCRGVSENIAICNWSVTWVYWKIFNGKEIIFLRFMYSALAYISPSR